MSDSTQAPRLRVETPSDIVELVPYLLGFAPQESVVILVIQAGVVQVTARADIAELEPAGAAEDVVDRIWHRFPDADAYLLAYIDFGEAKSSESSTFTITMAATGLLKITAA